MGKTQYAKSLAGNPDCLLEVNCSSGAEPDLRSFQHAKHKYILFDEIRPHVVLRQRKVFQAGPCMVDLGSSATNCHSYRRCLYQVRMVLSTNIWTEDLELLTEGDRGWLQENSVFVKVENPLWVTTEDAGDDRDEHVAI